MSLVKGGSKRKSGKKSKKGTKRIPVVTHLPKEAKEGEVVDLKVKKRGGGTRLQRFKATDRTLFKPVKNPKR